MFAPSQELIQEYAQATSPSKDPQNRPIQEMITAYVRQQLGPDPNTGQRRRVMMLLFQGEEAVRKIQSVVGVINADRRGGETIRDTFGDFVTGADGKVQYFEPAVLTSPTPDETRRVLLIWAKHSDQDGGVLKDLIPYPAGEQPQRTLVLIKPDNFRYPTGRPGNIIDFFSRTGLYIMGMKIHRMSVAQAMEFYQPVREVLRAIFTEQMTSQAGDLLEKELGYPIPSDTRQKLGDLLGPLGAENQFSNIIRFMSGSAPSECDPARHQEPGSATCIALVYEGPDAVRKIREVLGPTDPSKAPPGSIRREFGQNVLVNSAHASDSPENAQREIRIVDVAENTFKEAIEQLG
jgi:nucleoside diphosphate kinase